MMDIDVTFHPPETILEIVKAGFDCLTVVAFIALFFVVFYAKSRYPVIGRQGFLPLLAFVMVGIISTAMDAFDEFFWFEKTFYDTIWKPTRLLLMTLALILLIFSFYRFYQFSDRLFGDDISKEG